MHKHFADWYREANLEFDDETINLRWKGVENLLKKSDSNHDLDLIHILFRLHVPRECALEDFREAFKSIDSTFQMRGNDWELAVLAGAVICEIMAGQRLRAIRIAQSVVCMSFVVDEKIPPLTDITSEAKECLRNWSIKKTTIGKFDKGAVQSLNIKANLQAIKEKVDPANPNVSQYFDQVQDAMKKVEITHNQLSQYVKALTATVLEDISNLHEETDILWWIYNGTSRTVGKRFSSYEDPEEIALLVAKELAHLVRSAAGPLTASEFIGKVIASVGGPLPKESKLLDVVNKSPEEWRERAVKSFDSDTLYFVCPIHFALFSSVIAGGKSSWKKHFSEKTTLSANVNKPLLDFSFQFYQECLFLKETSFQGET